MRLENIRMSLSVREPLVNLLFWFYEGETVILSILKVGKLRLRATGWFASENISSRPHHDGKMFLVLLLLYCRA